ncbi:hypothetical protein DFJ73DRAFT_854286 [Zopfochytrium polystomum]|nr:hypothetical protein DFJ73DRAFT_854286 [Zopfochytrium polystomum]
MRSKTSPSRTTGLLLLGLVCGSQMDTSTDPIASFSHLSVSSFKHFFSPSPTIPLMRSKTSPSHICLSSLTGQHLTPWAYLIPKSLRHMRSKTSPSRRDRAFVMTARLGFTLSFVPVDLFSLKTRLVDPHSLDAIQLLQQRMRSKTSPRR